jgi:hypothetical protein
LSEARLRLEGAAWAWSFEAVAVSSSPGVFPFRLAERRELVRYLP